MADDYQFLLYEPIDDGRIVRIMLNRPEARNAQNRGMLVELNEAFLRAEADDEVRVVILGGSGKMFSSGHDLGSKASRDENTPGPTMHPTRLVNGGTRKGAEALMLQEWHYFFENTRRWRNLRKITIAQVLGGIGFTAEHDHHHHHSRVLLLDALLGSSAELTHGLGAWLRTTGADPRLTAAVLVGR